MVAAFFNVQPRLRKPLSHETGYRTGKARTARRGRGWRWPRTRRSSDCYAALYEVFSKETSWMKGPFWWAWDVKPPTAGDTGYNPRGKPAEDVLKQWQK